MFLLTILIKAAKAGKRILKRIVKGGSRKSHLSVTRRIERVKLSRRVVAMTFDDGPCLLPANPDHFGERALTDVILDIMKEYGARGTFDVVGDTSANYPDTCGKDGTPAWGGVKFDHYPDFGKDSFGGAVNCPEQIERILAEGHELSNHGYLHRLMGRQRFVYGARQHHENFGAVTEDLLRLHRLIEEKYGVSMTLSRPPHYVDRIDDALTSYDAYTATGYQYMAASFDGAGWLPSAAGYEEEVRLMSAPLAAALERDPDALAGQIIFQKDGYNMAHRSPVADGLRDQLELLSKYGYEVVSVSELLALCEVGDVGPEEKFYPAILRCLRAGRPVLFDDNSFRAAKPVTRGELAMFLSGREVACERVERLRGGERGKVFADLPLAHPYSLAAKAAVESGRLALRDGKFAPDEQVTAAELRAAFGRDVGTSRTEIVTAVAEELA